MSYYFNFLRDSGVASFFGTTFAFLLLFFPWIMDNNLIFEPFRQDAQFIYLFILIVSLMFLKFYNISFWRKKVKKVLNKDDNDNNKENKNLTNKKEIN